MSNTININVNKADIGLDQVNNTSDLNKPISTATQTALNGKEDVSNKSTDVNLGTSDTLYPTQNAVKTYVDSHIVSVPDATSSVKGIVKLTGDLGGTADSPTVPGLSSKQDSLGFTPENIANKSTDINLGTSDTLYPTQNAVKTYTDNILGNANALIYKGVIDCSTNPNYPSANAGELYVISVAGKIGGVSGNTVEVGDMLICNTDGTASGNQATVGTYWNAIQKNIEGYVLGAASSTNNTLPVFDGTTGKLLKQGIITDNGNKIGVDITSPTAKFHINNLTLDASFLVEDSSNPDVTPFIIDNAGNVGVGTQTPTHKLHIFNDNHLLLALERSGAFNVPIQFTNSIKTIYSGLSSVGNYTIGTNPDLNSAAFVTIVGTDGNVGIATSSPSTKLDINGNLKVQTIANATTDTDKFLVSDSGVVKYRTGAELLSDINGASKDLTLDRKTASYTLVAGDNNKLIEMNVATANNVTINNSVFTAGNQILVSQYGAGQVTFVAGAGVTLRSPSGKLKLTGQYSLATIIAISATEFYISGDLTA
jgi:hypothetical protein